MTEEAKKGRRSWKPAQKLNLNKKLPNHEMRWVDKEVGNYQRRLADGWVPISKVTSTEIAHDHPNLVGDGKPTGSVIEYRDMELMAIPKEDYEDHREYFRKQTEAQTAGLRKTAERENAANAKGGDPARIYGKIVIE